MEVDIKVVGWIALLSLAAGMILALILVFPVLVFLLIPYGGFAFWAVKQIFSKQMESHKLLESFSNYRIEGRTHYKNRTMADWVVVKKDIYDLEDAKVRLRVLRTDYSPQPDPVFGDPVAREWRLVHAVSGERIIETENEDLPQTYQQRFEKAMEKLDEALDR